MKHAILLVITCLIMILPYRVASAQDLNVVMWEEGILAGRFAQCFGENAKLDEEFGRTFATAYLRWYQANNPRADINLSGTMFVNGVYAGLGEQQRMGTKGCDAVYQEFSRIARVVGVRIPDNPNKQ